VVAVIKGISTEDRTSVGKALSGFSIACVCFLVVGIIVKEFEIMSPAQKSGKKERQSILRSSQVDQIHAIDLKVEKSGDYKHAYQELKQLITESTEND